MSENPFGPLSAEEFQKAVDAPYGRAGDILRKADPLWGRSFPDGDMSENPFGPLSAEEFQKAVDAPYGRAGDILRKADPLWGRSFPDGEKSRWKVTFRQQVTMQAIKYVEAGSEEEAEAIAETIPDNELTFDQYVDADDSELVSVVEAP